MGWHQLVSFQRFLIRVTRMFLEALGAKIRNREVERREEEFLDDAIERVVDGTNARVRLVSGYQNRLREGVSRCLQHIEDLVSRMPTAIEISRRAFATNPQVSAFFVNPQELQRVFGQCDELRAFFAGHPKASLRFAYVLLCMKKTEKTVLGIGLANNMLVREVPQTSVSFAGHQIFSPCASEAETREVLKSCLFSSIIHYARDRLLAVQSKKYELEADRRRIHTEIHIRSAGRAPSGARDVAGKDSALVELDQALANNARALRDLGADVRSPETYLRELLGIIGRPEEFLKVEDNCMRVSKMGIRIREGSTAGNPIRVDELEVGGSPDRVVVLAKFPREDLPPEEDPLREVSRLLELR
jgi:hypothetical protein